MSSIAIIGAQWGDEGKGKITDALSSKYDVVVRYQGGNNAGHTVYFDNKKVILHVIPSGILNKGCVSIIGHGVVVDPDSFLVEIDNLAEHGVIVTPENLKVSLNCPVVTSYHKLLDSARESGPNKIGTTGRGIGPTYEDKISRYGIKLKDLISYDTILNKLSNMEERFFVLKNYYGINSCPSIHEEAAKLYEAGIKIRRYLDDTVTLLKKYTENKNNIMFEGSQGLCLDLDYGTYPYVTSSNTGIGGIYTGAGLFDKNLDLLGVIKAYCTRVGEGPFPTELTNEVGEEIRNLGHEYGSTTGRKRRCGWLDLPMLKYSITNSGISFLALTKIDVLAKIKDPKVCVSYKLKDGSEVDMWNPGISFDDVTPVLKDMPKETYALTTFIEQCLGIPIKYISNGPKRKDFMEINK